MKFNDFYDAINSFNNSSTDFFSESVEDESLSDIFKEAISDYKRLIKRCKNEGLDLSSCDYEEYSKEYKTSTTIEQRREIFASLQDEIKNLLDSCDLPPKDITKKYSDDLVTRIENGIIDGFEVFED